MTDVTDLIAEDHARILGLFAALDDLARVQNNAGNAGLASAWDRLASFLALHIQAEEEICYVALLPLIARGGLLRDLTACYDDIGEALATARLHPPGSTLWWQAVTDARAAARRHIRAGTQQVLPLLGRQAPGRRSTLGRQWAAYTTARRRAATTPGPSPATSRPAGLRDTLGRPWLPSARSRAAPAEQEAPAGCPGRISRRHPHRPAARRGGPAGA